MLLDGMTVAMWVLDERVVAGVAAEVERPSLVHLGRGRILRADLHAADGVLHLVGHGWQPPWESGSVTPVSRPGAGPRVHDPAVRPRGGAVGGRGGEGGWAGAGASGGGGAEPRRARRSRRAAPRPARPRGPARRR